MYAVLVFAEAKWVNEILRREDPDPHCAERTAAEVIARGLVAVLSCQVDDGWIHYAPHAALQYIVATIRSGGETSDAERRVSL